jgi:hypothetical protein
MKQSYNVSRRKKQQHYQQVAKARQQQNFLQLKEWKQTQKCAVCGLAEEWCLDLHHVDPSTKDRNISDLVWGSSWSRTWEEIQKCVVLCANCHRRVHAGKITLTL